MFDPFQRIPVVRNLDDVDLERLPEVLRALLEDLDPTDEDTKAPFQSSI